MRTNAHIHIDQTLMPGRPPLDLELDLLKSEGLTLDNHEHEPTMYACMEWMIPPLIFAYFTKSYFDGFLGEMGADHYQILKKWVYQLNKKFKGYNTRVITASKSTNKIVKSNSPRNFFAVYFATPKGNRLKVFMPECETDDKDIDALSELLDNLKKLYTKPKSKFAEKINLLTDRSYEELFAVYNNETMSWEFYTGSMLVDKLIKNRTPK